MPASTSANPVESRSFVRHSIRPGWQSRVVVHAAVSNDYLAHLRGRLIDDGDARSNQDHRRRTRHDAADRAGGRLCGGGRHERDGNEQSPHCFSVAGQVTTTVMGVLEEATPERLMPLTGSFQKRLELRH